MRSPKAQIAVFASILALAAALVHIAAARPAGGPQEPEGQQAAGQGPVIRTEVSLVNLFATVRDKSKRIVPNLTQNDFRILEDNQEQKIAFFSRETKLPVTLGLLIDTSGSEQNRLMYEQDAASHFLRRVLRKGDEAMVISFDVDADLLADFTEDLSQLDSAIRRARIGATYAPVTPTTFPDNTGGTHFYDAIYSACHEKLAQEAGRKALVIITDAYDEGSKLRVQEAIEAAQRTDTVVHILLVYDPGYPNGGSVAKKIADETGGRLIDVGNAKRIDEAFDQISEELRSQYTLSYYPTNSARDGRFRRIRVEVTGKDMKILARKGYYAPQN
jgi:VWFA-related protein